VQPAPADRKGEARGDANGTPRDCSRTGPDRDTRGKTGLPGRRKSLRKLASVGDTIASRGELRLAERPAADSADAAIAPVRHAGPWFARSFSARSKCRFRKPRGPVHGLRGRGDSTAWRRRRGRRRGYANSSNLAPAVCRAASEGASAHMRKNRAPPEHRRRPERGWKVEHGARRDENGRLGPITVPRMAGERPIPLGMLVGNQPAAL